MKKYTLIVKDKKNKREYTFDDNNLDRLFCEHNDYQKQEFVDEKWRRLNIDVKDKNILDVGCCSGKIGIKCIENGCAEYSGFDSNWRYLEDAVDNGIRSDKLFLGDINKLVEKDILNNSNIDILLLLATFHYVKDKESFIKYLSEHVKEMLVLEGPVENGDPDFAPTFVYVEELLNKYFTRVELCGESVPPIPDIKKEYSKRFIWKAYKK